MSTVFFAWMSGFGAFLAAARVKDGLFEDAAVSAVFALIFLALALFPPQPGGLIP